MCVLNQEDDFNGYKSNFSCGMCGECISEYNKKENDEKYNSTSCNNCGMCEDCFY